MNKSPILTFENKANFKSKYLKRKLFGYKAYESWHTFYYLEQCFDYETKKLNQLNKKNYNLIRIKYIILFIIIKSLRVKKFSELGSTIFETIKGLNFLQNILKTNLNLKNMSFTGIEKSNIFNYISKIINKGYKINHIKLNNLKKVDLLCDRQVAPYVFKDENQLLNNYNKCRVVFANLPIYIKSNKTFKDSRGVTFGGKYTLFDMEKLKFYNKKIYYLFGRKSPNAKSVVFKKKFYKRRLDGFFLICNEKDFKKIVHEFSKRKYKKFLNFNPKKICQLENLKENQFYK